MNKCLLHRPVIFIILQLLESSPHRILLIKAFTNFSKKAFELKATFFKIFVHHVRLTQTTDAAAY